MQSAKVSSKIAALLSRICDYPNIPRKRKKFEVLHLQGFIWGGGGGGLVDHVADNILGGVELLGG